MDIHLVLFDCDGVLVDSEHISARIFSETIRRAGVHMSVDEVFATFKGGSMQQSLAHVEKVLGGPAPFDVAAEYRSACEIAYRNEMLPVAGIEPILQKLKSHKAVVSNGPQEKIRLNLNITGLNQYFNSEAIFSAYDFNKWKPDPTMLLEAAKSFNVHPQNSLVIGDSIADVLAAKAAGMKCYAYAPQGDLEGLADAGAHIIQDMSVLHQQLEPIINS